MNKEELEALERILSYANMSGVGITNTVYIYPSEMMIEAAQRLEQNRVDSRTLRKYWQKEKQRLEHRIKQ